MTKDDTWIAVGKHAFSVSDLRLVALPSNRALRLFFRSVQEPFTLTLNTTEERDKTHAAIRRCLGFN